VQWDEEAGAWYETHIKKKVLLFASLLVGKSTGPQALASGTTIYRMTFFRVSKSCPHPKPHPGFCPFQCKQKPVNPIIWTSWAVGRQPDRKFNLLSLELTMQIRPPRFVPFAYTFLTTHQTGLIFLLSTLLFSKIFSGQVNSVALGQSFLAWQYFILLFRLAFLLLVYMAIQFVLWVQCLCVPY
jgi:hypothetical protein